MTIGQLLHHQPTTSQYEIMQRADRMFPVGRYFGGVLTEGEITQLTYKVELRDGTLPMQVSK
jgi:hypothetical protein